MSLIVHLTALHRLQMRQNPIDCGEFQRVHRIELSCTELPRQKEWMISFRQIRPASEQRIIRFAWNSVVKY